MIKFKRVLLVLLLLAASNVLAQSNRSIPALGSLDEFRPPGDRRIFSFFGSDSTFGSLFSTVTSTIEVDGHGGLKIEEQLNIDFTKIRGTRVVRETGNFMVSRDGTYLGDHILMGTDDSAEQIVLNRQGDSLTGYYTRSGTRVPQSIYCPVGQPAWDNFYADQLELILALNEIRVGATITDTIFHPRSLYAAPFVARVTGFVYEEIYRNRFDSVFFIVMSQPVEAHLLFTPDRRLIKVDVRNQGYRIYQDDVRMVNVEGDMSTTGGGSGFSWVKLVALTPHYIAYVLLAAFALLLVVRNVFRWPFSYVGGILGIGGFAVASFSLIPLQRYIADSLIVPRLASGDTVYLMSLFPTLASGVIQTGILLGLLLVLIRLSRPTRSRYALLAACVGAGFAIGEASYQLGFQIVPLFSAPLVERGLIILFHVAAGALVGASLGGDRRELLSSIVAVVIINSLIRYLPVFVQARLADAMVMLIVMGTVVLLFALVVLVRLSRVQVRSRAAD